ncbi:hypothetical protein [Deinococcus cellulosilyticus]|uniref:Uncharacterized protein n=1 Tax=Deinococcus cellulosilyticus (strain DSM 18568 / NBRC 106333 / KACC 11606 / 5516J-15) TaxID=1223518 RepID=A0A511N7V2_DEIC1|nr:hypothetical protein [Deinococcus cellulosilyticus]GEM48587.1 hypothetical protein DC3_42220 [Deinococcus cellulosilyticus NBRC 106333 = KACC 11606]
MKATVIISANYILPVLQTGCETAKKTEGVYRALHSAATMHELLTPICKQIFTAAMTKNG